MALPFTPDEFFAVFERYNLAIWPVQVVIYSVVVAVLAWVLLRPSRGASLALGAVLAVTWVLMGVGYHLSFFRAVSPVAVPAGVLFVLAGLLFAWATLRGSLSFGARGARRDLWSAVGLLLVAYAMVGYPLLGAALGHHFPRSPVFGVAPCPTTIFTFGALLLAAGRVPGWLLAVPVAWALFGASAAILLGVGEDALLPVAAALGTAGVLRRNRASPRTASTTAPSAGR
jgi:hypothetical protein